jgi:adenylate kinase
MSKKILRGVIMGCPGSGKGTQVKRIQQTFTIKSISSGDELRHNIARKTELGLRLQSIINSGKLVSDDIITKLMFQKIKNFNDSFLLDGFPRTIRQAQDLDDFLASTHHELSCVINLDVPWEVYLTLTLR